MHFEAEHHFDGAPAAVAAVLADPAFYQGLELPDLKLLDVVEHGTDEQGSRVLLRYEYTGQLDATVLKLLGGDRLTWTQDVRLVPGGSGTSILSAEKNPGVLHSEVSFTLEPEADGCRRRLSGELTVGIPIIGAMAERRIVPGVVVRMDIEAEAINRRLAGN